MIMSSMNIVLPLSFLFECCSCIHSFLIALPRPSSTMSTSSVESRHPVKIVLSLLESPEKF